MTNENSVAKRTALITGANRGIGRAVAAELFRRNVRVVVTARDAEAARATATQIGPGVRSHDLVEQTLQVNLLGSWRVAQAFVPPMVRRGWGRVVLISSGTTAEFGGALFAGAPGYSISKSALNGLTTMLAAHTAGSGVLVNAVNPGRVRTRMMPTQQRLPEDAARFIADVATLPADGPTGQFRTEKRTQG